MVNHFCLLEGSGQAGMAEHKGEKRIVDGEEGIHAGVPMPQESEQPKVAICVTSHQEPMASDILRGREAYTIKFYDA